MPRTVSGWEGREARVLGGKKLSTRVNPIIIRLTHTNVWDSMGKPCSCMQFIKSYIFLLQVTREFVSVLQVA